jgi:hypothetical protein
MVHNRFTKSRVVKLFRQLNSAYVTEDEAQVWKVYRLHFVGMLCSPSGAELLRLLSLYFGYLRQIASDPNHLRIVSAEIKERLKFSDDEVAEMGLVLQAGLESAFLRINGGPDGKGGWDYSTPEEIDDIAEAADLNAALEARIERAYAHHRPVLMADAVAATQPLPDDEEDWFDGEPSPAVSSAPASADRRYQVFVSSTYEDLKIERSKVMQALLKSKCIPAGMELFPAAGESQWSLIKRVIDECDYYVVVLGDRYGSTRRVRGKKVSYTELEYNYAVRKKKVVLAFPKRDLLKRKGKPIEPKSAQESLKRFVGKISKRLYSEWSNAEELESAVKSAITHAIENYPQRGWVRAPINPKLGISPKAASNGTERIQSPETPKSSGIKVHFPNEEAQSGVAAIIRTLVRGNGEETEMALQQAIQQNYITTHRFIDFAVKESLVRRTEVRNLPGITLTPVGRQFAVENGID